eukprot:6461378-Amphidinium_carterae.1
MVIIDLRPSLHSEHATWKHHGFSEELDLHYMDTEWPIVATSVLHLRVLRPRVSSSRNTFCPSIPALEAAVVIFPEFHKPASLKCTVCSQL